MSGRGGDLCLRGSTWAPGAVGPSWEAKHGGTTKGLQGSPFNLNTGSDEAKMDLEVGYQVATQPHSAGLQGRPHRALTNEAPGVLGPTAPAPDPTGLRGVKEGVREGTEGVSSPTRPHACTRAHTCTHAVRAHEHVHTGAHRHAQVYTHALRCTHSWRWSWAAPGRDLAEGMAL